MSEGQNSLKSSSTSSSDSVKLFVGQVPKHMTEEQLLALFKEFALVDEVNIIKDKNTKTSRGCCFLICPSRQEADKAVSVCHNNRTLPGQRSCTTCRNTVTQLQKDLEDPELKIKVIRALLKACENTGDPVKECKKIVFKYGPLILANLDKYLTYIDLIYTLHLCDSAALHRTEALTNMELIEMPFARDFPSFTGKMIK